MGVTEDLEQARAAYERREWLDAYRGLSGLEDDVLPFADLLDLATAAYLTGRHDDCVLVLQRAYQRALDSVDAVGAARAAGWLCQLLVDDGELAVADGWAARAERLLDASGAGPDEPAERGLLRCTRIFRLLAAGDVGAALETAREVADFGERFDDADLRALGLLTQGRLLTLTGQVREGLRCMDEAMVGVVAGEVSPVAAGLVYCSMIEGCTSVSDFGRAAEWTHALTAWCAAQPGIVVFTGQCAVHRAQLLRLHGRYDAALAELDRAAERYELAGEEEAGRLVAAERGDVLQILGRDGEAEEAYALAAADGRDADLAAPGRALLWLRRRRHGTARDAVRRMLAEAGDPATRSRVLPAAAEVLAATGDVDEAGTAADELRRLAETFGVPALHAASACATARVAVARADAATATASARTAVAGWSALSATHEAARCRVVLGEALRLRGDEGVARAELRAARATFVAIGAAPDARRCTHLLGEDAAPHRLSDRELDVLRLVATGCTNAAVAAELGIAPKTVSRHLSNIFAKLDVTTRTAAAAFAYDHGLAPLGRSTHA
ncbi:LuxR C-terminal-related transcriptional regulator [Isoptericola sp. BMS4]|uniref:LuxR C-terminal-related transcriptional regulator n=1 Tax=Isoptericola sp. BMS4 TaxID=2527875 RepID=UPI001422B84E|nr:LuxR C-terminal-related transcriptional regulator [Isoptericola sp. BMS4]